jgi:putative membrane protein
MKFIIRLLVGTLAVFAAAYVLPGIAVDGWVTALIVAVVLGFMNAVLRPVLVLLTLPATILSLGLFIVVINALLVMLAAWFVPGFHVDGFLYALLFSVVSGLLGMFLGALTR